MNKMFKICSKCKKSKLKFFFGKLSKSKDGLKYQCKECRSEEYKKLKMDPEKLKLRNEKIYIKNKDIIKKKSAVWKKQNKDKVKISQKKYYIKNLKRELYRTTKWRKDNSEKINKKKRERRINDLNYRLRENISCRIRLALNKNKDDLFTLELLNCSINELKIHLESKFYDRKDGTIMTWNNYGYRGWHIDHIRPCASFDLTNPDQQKECFNYMNLQPLWMEDNFSKGAWGYLYE